MICDAMEVLGMKEAFEPLNPVLFSQLRTALGPVKVSSAGVRMEAAYDAEGRLNVACRGEQYHVNCPRCGDRRYRLSFSHRWGVKDKAGRVNLWMVNCFNENCYDELSERVLLYQLLLSGQPLNRASISPGRAPTNNGKVEPPGTMQPLHTLQPTHTANRYLDSRFIDPEYVSRHYGVSYCSESRFYLAKNRIIIPIRRNGELVGWQARYPGELDWHAADAPPKYYSAPGMNRSQIVYNIDTAAKYYTGVVVEGPMDVWSFGPMAMATLGFPPTELQMETIRAAFRYRSLVLLFDSDVMKNEKMRAQFEKLWEGVKGKCKYGVARVQLPEPFDPADLDRDYLWEFVLAEAAKQGVEVAWRIPKPRAGGKICDDHAGGGLRA